LPEIAEVFGEATYAAAPVNDPSGLATAMLDCLLDPASARARAVRAAAHIAREFSIDLCAARYEAHYEYLGAPLASRVAAAAGVHPAPVAHASHPPSSDPLAVSKQSHQETL
jgi:hypothetical protein